MRSTLPMRGICLVALALPLHYEANAQIGVGTMTLQEGSPLPKLRGGVVGDIAEDGSQKTFKVAPYGDGTADSPRSKSNERLPGLLASWVMPDGWFQPLVNPTNAQRVHLVSERPTDLPNKVHTRIDVTAVRAPDRSSSSRENSRIAGTGHFSQLLNPQTGESENVVGLPFTELALTGLRASGDVLHFYGKRWRPAQTGEAISFVTWDRVIGLNLIVEEALPAEGSPRSLPPVQKKK